MPIFLLHPFYTITFTLLLIVMVPRKDIQRLSLFGLVFGGVMDSIVHAFGYFTGLFAWTNFGPFGFIGVHLFSGASWTSFFIIYFYFLPRRKPFYYIFIGVGVFASVLYYNLLIDLYIFEASSRLILPLIGFTAWFVVATWAFLKWNHFVEGKSEEKMYPS